MGQAAAGAGLRGMGARAERARQRERDGDAITAAQPLHMLTRREKGKILNIHNKWVEREKKFKVS